MPPRPSPLHLSAKAARHWLIHHLGLTHIHHPPGNDGVRAVLNQLTCIQLDPLDTLGTNADLVVMARVDGLTKGQVYDALLPGHAFEHWAKERCLLPARAFPWYQSRQVQTSWWRMSERLKKLPDGVVEAVLEEVRAQGPATSAELSHQGSVEPIDWSGWKGTSSMTRLALEVLWTRCEVVVCERVSRGKRYDIPERALPEVSQIEVETSDEAFQRWALSERARACGLLSRAVGPQWGGMGRAHKTDLPEKMVAEGALVEVSVEGSRRRYLAPPQIAQRPTTFDADGAMRILGPLDPLIWDRKLVAQIFDFDYIWEVYKPAAKRRWGYYVCPLLLGDRLVGRLEGRVVDDVFTVETVWEEAKGSVPKGALDACLARHAKALVARRHTRPKRFS